MTWHDLFKRKPEETEAHHDQRVEVVVSKEATKKEVEKAIEANQHLNDLLSENHFTIKIFLATGGKTKKKVGINGH